MGRSTQPGSSPVTNACPVLHRPLKQRRKPSEIRKVSLSACRPSMDSLPPRMNLVDLVCNFLIPPITQHSRTQSQGSNLSFVLHFSGRYLHHILSYRMLLSSASFPLPPPLPLPPPTPLSALFTQSYNHNHPYPSKARPHPQHSHLRTSGPLSTIKKYMRFACGSLLPLLLVLLAQTR